MRPGIHCLTLDHFSFSFELLYLSLSSVSFSIFLFFCFAISYFCSSSVFSNCVLFALKILLLLFCTCSLSRCSCTFSLSHDFGFFIFAVPFSFILRFCFFFCVLSLAHLPFSSFLFCLGCLLTSFLFLSVFDSIFCYLLFFYGGFLMFLWFSFCSFLSHQLRFFLFLVNSLFSLFAPDGFLPDSCFFFVFLLCFQASFVLCPLWFFSIS